VTIEDAPTKGSLVLIVGTSSSGKTSVSRVLQKMFDDHYLLASTDAFFQMVNPDWGGGLAKPLSHKGFRYIREGSKLRVFPGSVGLRLLAGITQAMRTLLDEGVNIVYDEMIQTDAHWEMWKKVLGQVDATVVHLYADIDVLNVREEGRGRAPKLHGLAHGHLALNDVAPVDISIDTSGLGVQEVAERIYHLLSSKDG